MQWQKVRSIWLLVYQRHFKEFDWFIIGGDDLYVIVENLRVYLHSPEANTMSLISDSLYEEFFSF